MFIGCMDKDYKVLMGNERYKGIVMNYQMLSELLDAERFDTFIDAINEHPAFARQEPRLLIKAANLGASDCIRVLVTNGADVNPRSDSPFAAGKSVLLMVIAAGDFDTARFLLASGADPCFGFAGPDSVDYSILLAPYANGQPLDQTGYDQLITGIRQGKYPTKHAL